MIGVMKTTLALISSFTLLAAGYLSLSVALLRPPRVNYGEWFLTATLFVGQSVLTLLAVTGLISGGWIRWVLLAGSVAVIGVGAAWVYATVSGPHFEGYAVVLGSAVVVQGVLTLAHLSSAFVRATSASR